MKCVRNTFSFQWWQLIANTQQRIYKYKYNHLYTSNADSVRTKIKAIEYIYVVGLRYGWNRRRRLRVANWMTLAFHSCQTDSVFMHSSSVRWIREHWWKLGGNRFLPLRSENKFFSLKMFANALDIVSYFAYRTAYMYFHSLRRIFILLEKKSFSIFIQTNEPFHVNFSRKLFYLQVPWMSFHQSSEGSWFSKTSGKSINFLTWKP